MDGIWSARLRGQSPCAVPEGHWTHQPAPATDASELLSLLRQHHDASPSPPIRPGEPIAIGTAVLLPLTGGEAILQERYGALEYVYQAFLLTIVVCFFGLFWTRQGQTLGMMAWRLRIQREDGALLGWGDVIKRLVAALVSLLALGLGYFWIWIDRDRLAWPDRWTRTRVVVLPKKGT
jgi:uncharacterized RDD family membrane protein YckC